MDGFQDLTWADLESWAGTTIVSRGKSYQRDGHVRDLAVTESGGLIAWVRGTSRYATMVHFAQDGLDSNCSCPYEGTCKHAVAVVLEYLDCLKKKRPVPKSEKEDARFVFFKDWKTSYRNDDEEDAGIENGRLTVEDENPQEGKSVSSLLRGRSKNELIEMLSEILRRNPEIREEIQFKSAIKTTSVSSLVKAVTREIDKATVEPEWEDYRDKRWESPDYSRVRAGLEKLLVSGHADEVVELGEKLFLAATEQVGQFDDDGYISMEVSECMDIVFKALAGCSLPGSEKMERAAHFELRDEYELCTGLKDFWENDFPKKEWSVFADLLLARLKSMKPEADQNYRIRNYERDSLTDEIVHALQKAGRDEDIIPLCIEEAGKTHSYERLVRFLLEAGRKEEAEIWIRKGVMATHEKLPGIASSLRNLLLEIRTPKKDWAYIAALRADMFFEHPGFEEFKNLKSAAGKIQLWTKIRTWAIQFLETGQHPRRGIDWPLPETGLELSGKYNSNKPLHTHTLLEIALHEKKIDDIIRRYDAFCIKQSGFFGDGIDDRVAMAISDAHPDRAVVIWKRTAEGLIAKTNPKSYIEAAKPLRKIQQLLKKINRTDEWHRYLTKIRSDNLRKRRFVEILDSLEGKPILKT
jgi:uncharacterized Zn finger protein